MSPSRGPRDSAEVQCAAQLVTSEKGVLRVEDLSYGA